MGRFNKVLAPSYQSSKCLMSCFSLLLFYSARLYPCRHARLSRGMKHPQRTDRTAYKGRIEFQSKYTSVLLSQIMRSLYCQVATRGSSCVAFWYYPLAGPQLALFIASQEGSHGLSSEKYSRASRAHHMSNHPFIQK